MTIPTKLLTVLFCMFTSLLCLATTIVPYPNLGEMAKHSDAVVMVKALKNYEALENGVTRFFTLVQVQQVIKGPFSPKEKIALKKYHLKVDNLERFVWGDLEMDIGRNYLLLLSERSNGEWQPMMMSYGAFMEDQRDNTPVLVPFDLGAEVHVLPSGNGRAAEPFVVYEKEKLLKHLRDIVAKGKKWQKKEVATPFPVNSFSANLRTNAPGHCTYLNFNPEARWNNFPSALPVFYHSGGDPGCPTAIGKIQGVINTLNGSYTGINLTDGGTHSFTPGCVGQGATDNEFLNWVQANLGSRSITIQFDDPCDEIEDLSSNCSGFLAFGGMYAGGTHTWDGLTWQTAAVGYVVVNDSTGNCQCPSTDYDVMMTHELTHALGMGHIETVNGVANMNPSCCNFISGLDIQCLDYTYVQGALPVELTSFTGELKGEAIELNWVTASEYDNDYFILEKMDLNGKFQFLADVPGTGNVLADSYYDFMDEAPHFGTNYYRLTQVDFNGEETVHETIAIDYFKGIEVKLSPNPLRQSDLNILLSSETSGEVFYEVFHVNGKSMYASQQAATKGMNQHTLSLANLPKGIYLMRIQHEGEVITRKFVRA